MPMFDQLCLTFKTRTSGRKFTPLCKATFPELRDLRYYDSNTPAMDKLFHLSHRTNLAIESSCDFFNNVYLLGTYYGTSDCLDFEETEVFGTTVYSTISENNGEDASADDDYEPTILGSKIILE